jgi:hypothetical protein
MVKYLQNNKSSASFAFFEKLCLFFSKEGGGDAYVLANTGHPCLEMQQAKNALFSIIDLVSIVSLKPDIFWL